MVFEDFFPVKNGWALITRGVSFDKLNEVVLTQYVEIHGKFVVDYESGILQATGVNCRLGGQFDNRLVYSTDSGVPGVKSKTAHQPFVYGNSIYYTDDWPHVKIYRDDKELVVDHWDDYLQVGNPCVHSDTIYFEARNTDDPKAVDAWEIWKQKGKRRTFVCKGANPAWWNGLIVGEWDGSKFSYKRSESY